MPVTLALGVPGYEDHPGTLANLGYSRRLSQTNTNKIKNSISPELSALHTGESYICSDVTTYQDTDLGLRLYQVVECSCSMVTSCIQWPVLCPLIESDKLLWFN